MVVILGANIEKREKKKHSLNLQSVGIPKKNNKINEFIYAHVAFIVTTFNARFIYV